MSKNIDQIKNEILTDHKNHVMKNKEHLIKFDKLMKELNDKIREKTQNEQDATNQFFLFINSLQNITDDLLKKNQIITI